MKRAVTFLLGVAILSGCAVENNAKQTVVAPPKAGISAQVAMGDLFDKTHVQKAAEWFSAHPSCPEQNCVVLLRIKWGTEADDRDSYAFDWTGIGVRANGQIVELDTWGCRDDAFPIDLELDPGDAISYGGDDNTLCKNEYHLLEKGAV